MLPGLSGYLVSSAFLEADIASTAGSASAEAARAQLVRMREAFAALGPASSTRAVLETAATPLAALLGFDAPSDLEPSGAAIAGTIRGGQRTNAFVGCAWVAPSGPTSRISVTA